ncbi:hypothetical protein WKK05_41245 (plasmid) [Nostoc sp. UHCC 0302]|uniref:hypothetical protein n=1 Tax=Nostoc sp. UHCC 0302 TaxID=3134896 RepID=UPI00311CC623
MSAQSCTNYWINPKTGNEECFGSGALPTAPAQQTTEEIPGHKLIAVNTAGDKIYARINSLKRSSERQGWQNRGYLVVITKYAYPVEHGGAVESSSSYAANCNYPSLSLRGYTTYAPDKYILDSVSGSTPMSPVQEGTSGYGIWQYICSN